MDKKVKIQLFDTEDRIVEEKWIAQDSEFYHGPKEPHQGSMRLEFTFIDQGDVDKVLKYIQQLTGMLPLPEKGVRGRKSDGEGIPVPEFREDLLQRALTENNGDQDQLIKFLRDAGFVFVTWDYFQTTEYGQAIAMKETHADTFQWMVKMLKRAKNPRVDKYDPMLLFGISLMGERNEKVVVYLNGEFHKSYKVPVPDKPRETVKKTDMMKFDAAMIPEERDRFRFELRQLQLDPEREISKFFKRWRAFVENVPILPQDKKE